MKIIKLAKPKEFIYPEWTEAIQEAELAEKIVEWAAEQPCQDSLQQRVAQNRDQYYSLMTTIDCLKCPPCLARKLISRSCSEGKEGKP